MNKAEQHIIEYIKHKGYVIEFINDYSSSWQADYPKILFIAKKTKHGIYAAILHEYFHGRRHTKGKRQRQSANDEALGEEFVIRCFRRLRLNLRKQQRFVKNSWLGDCPNDNDSDYDYYVTAAKILIKKGLV